MKDKRAVIVELAKTMGVLRPKDLVPLGIEPRYLRHLAAEGLLTRSGRGQYTSNEFDVSEAHSLVQAVRTQSQGVVCLLSALNFHGIGTQLPHRVWLAIPYGARRSASESVPLEIVVVRSPAYEAGLDVHRLEGIDVPIYGVAKTVADCFKFRSRVGLDVAIEALKEALRDRRCSREEIRQFAKINRVENVMRPYMEAMAF